MKCSKPTIVVFGCTGTVGKEVMHQLSLSTCMIRGVLRSPDRAYPIKPTHQAPMVHYVSVDVNSSSQLARACLNADAVFLLTATAPDQVATEIKIIKAAQKVGVRRIVKLSAPLVTPPAKVEVSNWHREIEAYLAQTTLDYCCLRPYAFMQNWERNAISIQRLGKLFGSLGQAARNYIDCRDVAEVAVRKLLAREPLDGESITLCGPEAITNYDMAERLSYVATHKIEYIDLSPDAFFRTLTKRAKLPKWLANHLVELDDFALKVAEPSTDTLSPLLNRKPRIMDAYLQESRHLFGRRPIWRF